MNILRFISQADKIQQFCLSPRPNIAVFKRSVKLFIQENTPEINTLRDKRETFPISHGRIKRSTQSDTNFRTHKSKSQITWLILHLPIRIVSPSVIITLWSDFVAQQRKISAVILGLYSSVIFEDLLQMYEKNTQSLNLSLSCMPSF